MSQIDPESYGLTNLPAYVAFIEDWQRTVSQTYMGGTMEGASDLTQRIMEPDGGLLLALGMLHRILTSGDIATSEGAAGDIGIELLSGNNDILQRVIQKKLAQTYRISEEP